MEARNETGHAVYVVECQGVFGLRNGQIGGIAQCTWSDGSITLEPSHGIFTELFEGWVDDEIERRRAEVTA